MSRCLANALLIIVLGISTGCGPAPVVVTPDDDGDTTVVEERETGIVPDTSNNQPADTGTSVEVNIGGEKGVDVDVQRERGDAGQAPNP